jgi:maltose O-acetyltransferase
LPSLRNYIVGLIILEAGKEIRVKFNADISPNIKVGDYSELGERCLIYGGTEIGSEVLMGQDVKIFTQNHNFNDLEKSIRHQGNSFKKVVIGNDIWVCSNVVILPGVQIGSHSVIASGSVVTKSFPPYSIIGGNPARLIKKRI